MTHRPADSLATAPDLPNRDDQCPDKAGEEPTGCPDDETTGQPIPMPPPARAPLDFDPRSVLPRGNYSADKIFGGPGSWDPAFGGWAST